MDKIWRSKCTFRGTTTVPKNIQSFSFKLVKTYAGLLKLTELPNVAGAIRAK